jgi:hypothetical protein
MRLYFILLVTLLTSCKSVELKQIVWNFLPMKVHLGTDLQTISGQLDMDTTRYSWTGYKRQVKQFRLDNSYLKKLTFDNNYFDSLRLNFYSNKLLSIDFYASGNRNVEFLKFDLRGQREAGLSKTVTFRKGDLGSNDNSLKYGEYRQLYQRSAYGPMTYEYFEDIVDNVAMLTITNRTLLKIVPKRRVD